MSETMYVALMLEEFEFECADRPHLLIDVDKGRAEGYLPVYRTLEDLREDYPGADYVCIREGRMIAREGQ